VYKTTAEERFKAFQSWTLTPALESKHDSDGWRQRHKTKGFFAKQWLCTCDTDFGTVLCRPRQNNNVKWPNSKFYVEREHTTVNFLFSTWTIMSSLQSQLPDCSATLDRLNELKLLRTSLKYLEVIFKATFSLALPLWLLKLPNDANESVHIVCACLPFAYMR